MTNRLVSVDEDYMFPAPLEARMAAKIGTAIESSVIIYGNGYTNPPAPHVADGSTRGLWHLDASLADSSAYNRTLTQYQTNQGAYTVNNKFGGRSLNGGVYENVAADKFLSSTGADGGTFATGTVECWVYSAPYTTGSKVALSHQNWYWLGITSAGLPTARYGSGAGEAILVGSTPITSATYSDAAWHHLALVLENGIGRLYVDGKLAAGGTTAKTAGTQAGVGFTVGGLATNRTYDWSLSAGHIDEIRLSDVARYSAEPFYPTRPASLQAGSALFIGPTLPPERQPFDQWIRTETA